MLVEGEHSSEYHDLGAAACGAVLDLFVYQAVASRTWWRRGGGRQGRRHWSSPDPSPISDSGRGLGCRCLHRWVGWI